MHSDTKGQNYYTPSSGKVQHLRGLLVEPVVLEDIRRRQLSELSPVFDQLSVLGLLVEMFSIGFHVIVLVF